MYLGFETSVFEASNAFTLTLYDPEVMLEKATLVEAVSYGF